MTDIIRRTWAEIDLDALGDNLRAVRAAIPRETRLCAVVKADAYGHGAVHLARELDLLGADWFAVSNLEEALQLRRTGIRKPVLVLGFTPAEEAATLAENEISQCLLSGDYARALSAQAAAAGVRVRVHVKIDTGMSRLGFSFQDRDRDAPVLEELKRLCALPGLAAEGVFTHFAVSDGGPAGEAFTLAQFARFQTAADALQGTVEQPLLRHCANSAAIFDYPQTHLDMVRAGIVLYGLAPSGELVAKPALRPLLSLRSVVSHVKTLEPGATVSYGRVYTAESRRRVATVPVGYADGYPRLLGAGGAQVLIHGRRCPILGRVCMDQLMADVTDLEQVAVGDRVTLIGRDGNEVITADELAAIEGTINYEVICGISKRVPRVYLKHGAVESIYNQLLGS